MNIVFKEDGKTIKFLTDKLGLLPFECTDIVKKIGRDINDLKLNCTHSWLINISITGNFNKEIISINYAFPIKNEAEHIIVKDKYTVILRKDLCDSLLNVIEYAKKEALNQYYKDLKNKKFTTKLVNTIISHSDQLTEHFSQRYIGD